jgi:pimeloyl-ACP methyl ester carboxylesterase
VAHAAQAPGTMALHLFDDVGHTPQIECPDAVARLIDELVRSTGH